MKLNLIGPVNSLSYGVVTKNILINLFELGHEVSLLPIHIEEQEKDNFKAELKRAEKYDSSDITLKIWHQFDASMPDITGEKVLMTIFELNKLTDNEVEQLNSVSRVVVCSRWAKQVCIDSGVTVPIYVVPLGVDRLIFNESNRKNSKTTRFGTWGKNEIRKSHDIIPIAFSKAFRPDDNVSLHVCTHNPFYTHIDNKRWADYFRSMIPESQLIIEEERLGSQNDIANIMRRCDVNLALSRAEGWNLELLESFSCGCHAIVTNYSAHTQFANKGNSKLIDVDTLEDAIDGYWFKGFGEWACLDNKIDDIVKEMRYFHNLKQSGRLEINNNGIETAKKLSWRNTTEELIKCLK